MSRRHLLQGLSLLAAGSLTACTSPGLSGKDDVAAGARPVGQLGSRGPGNKGRLGDASSLYQAPYTLEEDCVLSEDHFLLKLGDYDPDVDLLAGYPQNNTYVPEAIMALHSQNRRGAVVQLYHDWNHDQAWALAPVSVSGTELEQVEQLAVGRPQRADGTIGSLHMFYRDGSGYAHVKQLDDSSWQSQAALNWTDADGTLYQSVSPAGGKLFYAFDGDVGSKLYWRHVAADDTFTGGVITTPRDYLVPGSTAKLCALSGSGALTMVMAAPGGPLSAWQAAVAATGSEQNAAASRYAPLDGRQPRDPVTKQTAEANWVCALFSRDESLPPVAIVMDFRKNQLWSLSTTGSSLLFTMPQDTDSLVVTMSERALRASGGAAPPSADKVLDLYIRTYYPQFGTADAKNTVQVVHQLNTGDPVADSQNPTFSGPVPLLPDIGALAVPGGRSSSVGFIAMDLDGSLQLMTVQPIPANPVTGAPAGQQWVGTPIHLPAPDASIQVSSYRVQLTLTDAAGLPVLDTPMLISCPQQLTAMCNGAAVPLGPSPVSLQTNGRGQVTLAIAADGLSCPPLTVTAEGVTKTVQPAAGVNTYFTGTTGLNGLPPLTPGGKITSTTTVPADQFATMQFAAKAGIAAPSSLGAARGHSKPPPRLTLRPVHGSPAAVSGHQLGGFFDDFAHDVVQAVKAGVAEVTSTVTAAATAAEKAVVTVFVTLADGAKQQLDIAIYDLESAAAAIHSLINQIGAAIGAAVDWLKAAISGLFTDTALLAAQYDAWIHDACGFAQKQIATFEGKANNWFATQKNVIDAQLTSLQNSKSASTSMSGLTPSKSSVQAERQLRGAPSRAGGLGDDAGNTANPGGAHSNWLMDKIEQVFDSPSTIAGDSAIDNTFGKLVTQVKAAGGSFSAGTEKAIQGLEAAITNPSAAKGASLSLFLTALQDLVDGAIDLADAITEGVLELLSAVISAIEDILDTTVGDLPIIGPLLQGTALGNLTLGRLVCLMYAFPAMIAYKLSHNGGTPSWLRQNPTATRRALANRGRPGRARRAISARPARTALGAVGDQDFETLAAMTTFLWNFHDGLGALYTSLGKDVPWYANLVDVVGASVLAAFAWPGPTGSAPFGELPVTQSDSDQLALFSYLLGLALLPTAVLATYVDRRYPDTPANKAVRDGFKVPIAIVNTCSGLLGGLFAVGSAAEKSDHSAADVVDALFYNLPAALSFLLLEAGIPPAIVAICCGLNDVIVLVQLAVD